MRAFTRNCLIIVCALIVGVVCARIARADGVEGGYKDSRPVYRHHNSSGELKKYLTASEKRILKRIHRDASARMNGRRVNDTKRAYSGTNRVYAVQPRRRYIEPIRYERDTRECKAPIDVTGHERLGRARAANSARNAWRTTTSDRWGYRYANLENARGENLDCTKVRGNSFPVYVCALRARPCKDF